MTTETENEAQASAETPPAPRRARTRGRSRTAAATAGLRAQEPQPAQPPRSLLLQPPSAHEPAATPFSALAAAAIATTPTGPIPADTDRVEPTLSGPAAPEPAPPGAIRREPFSFGSTATGPDRVEPVLAGPDSPAPAPADDAADAPPPAQPRPPRATAPRPRQASAPATRPRTITVPTAGLGAVTVRRLSLGAIASAAAHYRATGEAGDAALVEALIAEASQPVNRAAGVRRRRLDDSELEQLSEEDRDALATAVLALEGVAPAADGVPEVPRLMLARRYARIIGSGERVERSVRAAVKPLAESADRLEPTLSRGTVEAVAGELAGSAALRDVLEGDDWPERLREHPDFAIDVQELLAPPEPAEPSIADTEQLPLFDGDAAAATEAGLARSAPRTLDRLAARVDDIAESQRQLLQWHAQTKQAVGGGITDLALRLQERDGAERKLVRVALAFAAAFAVALVALAGWTLSLRSDLVAARAALAESERRHEAALAELRRPAAQTPPARPAAKPAAAPRKPPARQ